MIPRDALNLKAAGQDTPQKILQALLDTAREAVLIVDGSLRIAAANTHARTNFSLQDGTLEGRRLSEVVRDLKLHEAFRGAVTAQISSDLKLQIIGRETRTYDIHVAPIELEGVRSSVGVFYDVTQIERLERIRQEFLSNISHELRTPLTSILAFVETLEDGAIDDKENNRRFLGVIRRNAERMHVLIADILELSLIESGRVSIEIREIKLSNLVDDVLTGLGAAAASRDVTLINEIDPDAVVLADPARLEQMLTNLIENAIKFNRPNGSVTLGCSRIDDKNVITVADTGDGIRPDLLSRIFERFYRVDRGRTREAGGTGLGLAIVKHLARLQGGEVTADSELGKGTVFSIELPALLTTPEV